MAIRTADVLAAQRTIGDRWLRARKNEEQTQEWVARAVGVTVPMISQIENGHKTPNLRLSLSLSRALKVSLGFIYSDLSE